MTIATKERPIIFSAPMVKAILDGRKTQTRRIVKEMHAGGGNLFHGNKASQMPNGGWQFWSTEHKTASLRLPELRCPYGAPGERLWVREAWRPRWVTAGAIGGPGIEYRADGQKLGFLEAARYGESFSDTDPWRSPIYMPRWASRITLEITDVKVQRLRDITRGDCIAEGCPFQNIQNETEPIEWFRNLWIPINGNDSWKLNPWVWVVQFKKI